MTRQAFLAGADGVLVETVLRRAAVHQPLGPTSGLFRSESVRVGESLVQLASGFVATAADHDRATVVLHFDAN